MTWRLTLLAVGAVALAAGLAVLDSSPVGVFHDDAMYVILGRSLATGQGYRYLNLPGAPTAAHFPPGYPALLALAWRIAPRFPQNLAVFKCLNAAFLSMSAMLVAQLVRDRLGARGWAVGVAILSAVSVPLLVLVTMVLSEPLFLVLLLATLVVAERFIAGPESVRRAAGIGLLIGASILVRAHGIVLIPAVALPLGLQRRWREAAVLGVTACLVVMPWQLWSAANAGALPAPLEGNYGSYVGWWMAGFRAMGPVIIPLTLAKTVPETLSMIVALFSPLHVVAANVVTLLAFAAVAGAGVVALRRRAPATLLFTAAYTAIVLVWPFPPTRFFWGVWPVLACGGAAAGWAVTRHRGRWKRIPRLAVAAALLWLSAGYGRYEVRGVRGRWWTSIPRAGQRRIDPAIAWTLSNTSPGDVVAADDEGAVFLYTGRRAVPVVSFTTAHYLKHRTASEDAADGLERLLAAYPLRAVLVGSGGSLAAAQHVASRAGAPLVLREQFDGGAAFTVVHP